MAKTKTINLGNGFSISGEKFAICESGYGVIIIVDGKSVTRNFMSSSKAKKYISDLLAKYAFISKIK